MAVKPNETALIVLKAAHAQGGWLSGSELAALTGLTKSRTFSALERIVVKGDEWCGVDGWSWRMQTNQSMVGGTYRQIRIDRIVAVPVISSASERVRAALAQHPELSIRELAALAGCSEPTASLVRKEFRLFGVNGKPKGEQGRKGRTGETSAARGTLMEDELMGGRMNRRFRQLWPMASASVRGAA